jgi:prevent-host-death family protein
MIDQYGRLGYSGQWEDIVAAKQIDAGAAVSLSDAKTRLSELVDTVRTKASHVVIEKRERPVAALVDIGRFRRLQEIEDRTIRQELRAALKGPKRPLRRVLEDLDLGV